MVIKLSNLSKVWIFESVSEDEKVSGGSPPPVRRSEGLQDPPTSNSSRNKTPEVSLWSRWPRLSVRPAVSEKNGRKQRLLKLRGVKAQWVIKTGAAESHRSFSVSVSWWGQTPDRAGSFCLSACCDVKLPEKLFPFISDAFAAPPRLQPPHWTPASTSALNISSEYQLWTRFCLQTLNPGEWSCTGTRTQEQPRRLHTWTSLQG